MKNSQFILLNENIQIYDNKQLFTLEDISFHAAPKNLSQLSIHFNLIFDNKKIPLESIIDMQLSEHRLIYNFIEHQKTLGHELGGAPRISFSELKQDRYSLIPVGIIQSKLIDVLHDFHQTPEKISHQMIEESVLLNFYHKMDKNPIENGLRIEKPEVKIVQQPIDSSKKESLISQFFHTIFSEKSNHKQRKP